MTAIITVIHVFVTIALVGAILIQRSEGGGLGIGSSGGGMSGFMTGRGTANVLTRTTAILAVVFMLTSLTLTWMATGGRGGSIMDNLVPAPASTAPAAPAPGAPASGTANQAAPGAGGATSSSAPAAPAPGAPAQAPAAPAAPSAPVK